MVLVPEPDYEIPFLAVPVPKIDCRIRFLAVSVLEPDPGFRFLLMIVQESGVQLRNSVPSLRVPLPDPIVKSGFFRFRLQNPRNTGGEAVPVVVLRLSSATVHSNHGTI